MATAKSKPEAKSKPSTAVAKWDEELARQAALAAGMEESTSTGNFFGLAGGVLSYNDVAMPGNEMAVIIIDSILENVYYEGKYDINNPQAPKCFAFGRVDKEMAPHKTVIESENQQCGESGLCSDCQWNEWASAETGRGKACRNTRRLAMIPAGSFENGKFKPFTEEDHFESAAIVFMKLPVTSVKGYAGFVKQVVGALKRPPHAIYTRVKVVPDPANQFKVIFEPLIQVPNELLSVVMKRHEEAMSTIDFPYTPFEEVEAPAPRRSNKAAKPAAKPAAKGGARKPAGGRKY